MKLKRFVVLFAIIAMLVSSYIPAFAESVQKIADVPEGLPAPQREELNAQKALLMKKRSEIREETDKQNKRCTGVEENSPLAADCAHEQNLIEGKIRAYSEKVRIYNENVRGEALKAEQSLARGLAQKPDRDRDAIRDEGSAVVDLRDVDPNNESQGLVKNQWDMSIDWRYRHDPVIQQYIREIWNLALSSDQDAEDKLENILRDQMLAKGRSPQQIDEFFGKVKTFLTGVESVPRKWEKTSKLAQDMDAASASKVPYKTEKRLAEEMKTAQSIEADVSYEAPGAQGKFDCALYAIANGAQVPLEQVNKIFRKTIKDLGMDAIEVRQNPALVITDKKNGGRGGANPFEELLVAEQLGEIIPIPRNAFARAIAATGKPVVTVVQVGHYMHEVVVTGVYRTKDGAIYYAVMDSTLSKHKNFTKYVEKSEFERETPPIPKGGYVIVPFKKP